MTTIWRLFILVQLYSCSDSDNINVPIELRSDSILRIEVDSDIPTWISARYPPKFSRSAYDTVRQEIVKYTKKSGSLSYCIYEQSDAVCLRRFLAVFEQARIRDSLEIEVSCDHDMSYGRYNWKESRQVNDSSFYIISYSERLPDKYLSNDGMVKDGYDYLDLENETIRDSVVHHVNIGKDNTRIDLVKQ